MIAAIVCVDKHFGIGSCGQLLESYPEDMTFFKEKTSGNIVVMGRKTWDSLPKKPLSNRFNIVITSSSTISPNSTAFLKLNEFIKWLPKLKEGKQDIYIIGGASIYKQLLPYCDKIYMTMIPKVYENADTFFPQLESDEWKKIKEEQTMNVSFIEFIRKT